MDGRSEQLGQRRGDRLKQCLVAHEAHIGLDGKSGRRQRAGHRYHVAAVETEACGEDEPALDPTLFAGFGRAVMILDPMAPFAPQFPVEGAADQGGVLPGHARLIAVAIECPRLYLPHPQFAAVQQVMKRVLVVIALSADRAQCGFKGVGCQGLT